ncbi:MAG: NADH-quinone oxidoreductase subunit NuoG [Aestuariibacter sp.]
MITITIDNVSYEVEAEQNLLQAVLSLGLDLPYFCWHPDMGSVGACRQCAFTQYQDDNDTRGRLGVACMTPVSDGMRISLQQEPEVTFREQVIAALMTNHPHDCPVCAEGGDCHLQDMTVMTGHFKRDYPGRKRTFENQDLGPFIKHEMNRCITCYRCVRFYRDYAGGDDLAAMASKNHVYFGRHQDGQLESPFSGNLVEVCPTGVFTDKVFGEHYSRKWDLQSAPSVCQHCSVGCNLSVGERYGSVRRVVNRYNPDINGHFLCDRGRFGFHFVNSQKRRREIQIGQEKFNIEWQHPQLQENLKQSRNKKWLAIGSPHASLEDNFALQQLVGAENFAGFNHTEAALAQRHLALLSQFGQVSLRDIEQADCIVIVAEPIDSSAPRTVLAVRQALNNNAKAKARHLQVPDWQDAAVKQLLPDNPVPLFILGPQESALSDDAQVHCKVSENASVEILAALAHRLDDNAPPGKTAEQYHDVMEPMLEALKTADNPIIITGWHEQSLALLNASANLAKALPQKNNKLAVVAPDSNSVGLAWLISQSPSPDIETLLSRIDSDTALIMLHAGTRECLSSEAAISALQKAEPLIDLGMFDSVASDLAQVRLPVTAFSEQSGTMVNYQGRAQTFVAAVHEMSDIKPARSWCQELAGLIDKPDPGGLVAIREKLEQRCPPLVGIWTAQGHKTARQSPRYSGRTALLANQTMHEPKPAQDGDSDFNFSMEGLLPGREGAMPFTWHPGWNSNQSSHKFKSHESPVYLTALEESEDGYAAVGSDNAAPKQYHCYSDFYQADYFSAFAPHIAATQSHARIRLSGERAAEIGVNHGGWINCSSAAESLTLQVQIDEELDDDCLVLLNADLPHESAEVTLTGAGEAQIQAYQTQLLQQKAAAEKSKADMLQALMQQDQQIPIHFVGESKS